MKSWNREEFDRIKNKVSENCFDYESADDFLIKEEGVSFNAFLHAREKYDNTRSYMDLFISKEISLDEETENNETVSSAGLDNNTKALLEEIYLLQQELNYLKKKDLEYTHSFDKEKIKIGLVSDTHLCSYDEDLDLLYTAYNIFKKEGIENVYHSGDLLDGEYIYKGHIYNLNTVGADNQIKYAIDNYPKVEGITTYFITGNHDLSFYKRSQINVGTIISNHREDLVYLGSSEADVKIENMDGSVLIRLSHPGKGTAYSVSYNAQKYIESLPLINRPKIIFQGHYHKAMYLPNYLDTHFFYGGTTQKQTHFMQERNIMAMMGFWIIEFEIGGDNIIQEINGRFFPKVIF